jgi:hypothetical protein
MIDGQYPSLRKNIDPLLLQILSPQNANRYLPAPAPYPDSQPTRLFPISAKRLEESISSLFLL